MAEEKKTPAKVEEGKLAKVLNWFKKLPGRIAKPFKNMVAELRKVTWPSKKKLIASSITVLLFMLFMGVVIGLLDLGATTVVQGLSGVVSVEDAADAADTDDTADETADTTDAGADDQADDVADDNADAADDAADANDAPADESAGSEN